MGRNRFRRMGTWGCLLAVWPQSGAAWAHTLMLSHGTLRIEPSVVWVSVEARGADVLHVAGVEWNADGEASKAAWKSAADDFAILLMRSLAVHDRTGKRLGAKAWPHVADPENAGPIGERGFADRGFRFQWGFDLAQPEDALTFRLQIPDDTRWHAWQMVIEVQESGAESPPLLRLTSRGNAETLIISQAAPGASDGAVPSTHNLRMRVLNHEPALRMDLEDNRLTVDWTIPLPALETWVPLIRDHPDYLTSTEQKAAEDDIRKLLFRALQFEIDGLPGTGTLDLVRFGPIGSSAPNPAVDVGFWAGWTLVRQTIPLPSSWHRAAVTCRCFNSAVLSIPAELRWPGSHRQTRLTTQEPTVVWHRSSTAITLKEAE